MPKLNISFDALDKYRKTWTSDVPAGRDFRFETEMHRSTKNSGTQFQMPYVRMLPG